jgi:hypothetical protein
MTRGQRGDFKKKGENLRSNPPKSLKTHIEIMSTFRLSKMLLKTHKLSEAFQDVAEKKDSYQK